MWQRSDGRGRVSHLRSGETAEEQNLDGSVSAAAVVPDLHPRYGYQVLKKASDSVRMKRNWLEYRSFKAPRHRRGLCSSTARVPSVKAHRNMPFPRQHGTGDGGRLGSLGQYSVRGMARVVSSTMSMWPERGFKMRCTIGGLPLCGANGLPSVLSHLSSSPQTAMSPTPCFSLSIYFAPLTSPPLPPDILPAGIPDLLHRLRQRERPPRLLRLRRRCAPAARTGRTCRILLVAAGAETRDAVLA